MSVAFDYNRFVRDFRLHLLKKLKQLRREFMNEARSHMLQAEAVNDLAEGEIEEAFGVMVAIVIGGAWVAMDEWGTGSLMDANSNPAFAEYRRSELWNPARRDLKIRGRPPGDYVNIFGETVRSTGKMMGRDLEAMGIAEPSPPSYALQTAARWLKNGRVQVVLKEAIETFPWGRYIIAKTGGRR